MAAKMAGILETERLILRTWECEDVDVIFEICSDPQVMLHIGDGKPFEKIADAEKFLDWTFSNQKTHGFSRYAVVERASGKIIGSCGFALLNNGEIELGYLFGKDFWGKGFATEAANACVKYGFEKLGFTKLVALTDIDHAETHRVLEKIGFTRRGIEKIHIDDDLVFESKNQSETV